MPVKRVYLDQSLAPGTSLRADGDTAHYLGRVLRARAGDPVRLFNGDGNEYAARVSAVTRDAVTLDVDAAVDAVAEPAVRLTLLQSLSRNEKMDLAIQKAVELGAAEIRPVAVARSVMKLDAGRGERRLDHWRQVAVHAAQQCGRARIPEIHAPASLADALADAGTGFGIVADPAADMTLAECLARAPAGVGSASLLVGPEGGLTPAELELALAAGLSACRAGPRVLRTETAAVALLAILQFRFGDLGAG